MATETHVCPVHGKHGEWEHFDSGRDRTCTVCRREGMRPVRPVAPDVAESLRAEGRAQERHELTSGEYEAKSPRTAIRELIEAGWGLNCWQRRELHELLCAVQYDGLRAGRKIGWAEGYRKCIEALRQLEGAADEIEARTRADERRKALGQAAGKADTASYYAETEDGARIAASVARSIRALAQEEPKP